MYVNFAACQRSDDLLYEEIPKGPLRHGAALVLACGYTDMIYYYLVKNGTDLHRSMTSEEFHDHIQKQYDNVMDGVY